MRDFLKGMTIIVVLFSGLSATVVASSRPDKTLEYARATAHSICKMPGSVTAVACRQIARFRPVRTGQPNNLRT